MRADLTPMERVLTTLAHREPDRVPFFIPVTIGGARELGMSVKEYLAHPESMVEGQIRKNLKYGDDFVCNFSYGAADFEAWGGEVIFYDDGPPTSGEPFLQRVEDILQLEPPRVAEQPCLQRVIEVTKSLKERVGGATPIVGVFISPFSLPVMQMGFEKYLDVIYERPELFEHLVRVNEEFCVQWANAQLAAGATFVVSFDPVSSTTVIPAELYVRTGLISTTRVLDRLAGPMVIHMASGRCLPIIDHIAESGAAGVAVSVLQDLGEIKDACRGRITVLGNLNAIEMRRWSAEHAETMVKQAIAAAGPGGGYVLADNHGEIPWQVPEDVLLAISEAVRNWGKYPLTWVGDSGS